MKFVQLGLFALLATCTLAHSAFAQCRHNSCCVCGKKVCVLEVSKEEESVTRFDVEPKEICIPGIKLPWSCTRNCGGVRKVCVLKEVKQEKTVCKYDWSIRTICTTCCRRNGLKHHHAHINKPLVNQDERLPFEYYAADVAEKDANAAPSTDSKLPAAIVPSSQEGTLGQRPVVARVGSRDAGQPPQLLQR